MVVVVVMQTEQSCGMLNHMTMLIGSREVLGVFQLVWCGFMFTSVRR